MEFNQPSQIVKNLNFGNKAKNRIIGGVDKLAQAVKSTKVKEIVTDTDANKKIWKGSDIAKMKPWEFEKFEKEIDLARQEGRINMNS